MTLHELATRAEQAGPDYADIMGRALVQAFARHRIAALEEAAKVADRHDTGDMTREDMEARRIAAEIRSLTQ